MSIESKEPPAHILNKIVSGTPIRRESLSFTNFKSQQYSSEKNNSYDISPSSVNNVRRESLSYTNVQLHENRRYEREANEALFRHDAALIAQLQQENNILKQQRLKDKSIISEYVIRTHNLTEDVKLKETLLEANKNLLQSIYKQLNILTDLAKTKEIVYVRDHLQAVISTLSCHDSAFDILNVSINENTKKNENQEIEKQDVKELSQLHENSGQTNDLYKIKSISDKISSFRKLFNDVVETEDEVNNKTEIDEMELDNEADIEAILADEILMLMKENKQLKQSTMKMEKNLKATTSTAIDISLKEAEENSRLQLELLASNQEILKLREKIKSFQSDNTNLFSSVEEFRRREIELLQALEGVLIRVHELESNVWLDAVDMRRNLINPMIVRKSPINNKPPILRPFKI